MKIKKFLLYDNATNDKTTYMDLIILDNECEQEKIYKAITDFKDKDYETNGFYTYSNEDIYNVIKETCGNFSIHWLGDLEQFEY